MSTSKSSSREGSPSSTTTMKQGQLMLYDNNKATWQKVYAVLGPHGFCLHATGNRGSQNVCPPVQLCDIRAIYRPPRSATKVPVDGAAATLPHMHTVMIVVQTGTDLHICRTSEPKGLQAWIKTFEELLVKGGVENGVHSDFNFCTIDDLRPMKSYLAPQLYTMLFRSRPDPNAIGFVRSTGAGVNRSAKLSNGATPAIPKNLKEVGRRASLSAGTPVRGGNLPMRRAQPALVPIVSTSGLTPATTPNTTPAGSKAPSPEAAPTLTANSSAAVTPEQTRGEKMPLSRTHGLQPQPTTKAPPNTPAGGLPPEGVDNRSSSPIATAGSLMVDLTPAGKAEPTTPITATSTTATPSPSAFTASSAMKPTGEQTDKENMVLGSSPLRGNGAREKSPLDVASPAHVMSRLNTLQNKTKESETNTKDDVIANLKKQVESLTRRNIDLQVDNVNTQARLLELEEMVSDAQNETGLWQDKFASLQRQMKLTDENVENRIQRLKEEWLLSMQEEVQAQWGEMRAKWEEKEKTYKNEIETLQRVNADLLLSE